MDPAHGVRWDAYALVHEALEICQQQALAPDDSLAAARLVAVCFADRWSKTAMSTALSLESVRQGREVEAFAQSFVVDAATEPEVCWELGVTATPALLLFWDGQPVTIRRPDWADDTKLSGAFASERVLEIIRHTRDSCLQPGVEGVLVSFDW